MFAVENYFYPLKASRLNCLGFVSILGHYPSIDRPLAVFCLVCQQSHSLHPDLRAKRFGYLASAAFAF